MEGEHNTNANEFHGYNKKAEPFYPSRKSSAPIQPETSEDLLYDLEKQAMQKELEKTMNINKMQRQYIENLVNANKALKDNYSEVQRELTTMMKNSSGKREDSADMFKMNTLN
jgi:hypothetical protein